MHKALITNWDTFVWHYEHESIIVIIFTFLTVLIHAEKWVFVNYYWQNFVFLTKENILSFLLAILCSNSSFLNNNLSQDEWVLNYLVLNYFCMTEESPAPPPHFCCHGFKIRYFHGQNRLSLFYSSPFNYKSCWAHLWSLLLMTADGMNTND